MDDTSTQDNAASAQNVETAVTRSTSAVADLNALDQLDGDELELDEEQLAAMLQDAAASVASVPDLNTAHDASLPAAASQPALAGDAAAASTNKIKTSQSASNNTIAAASMSSVAATGVRKSPSRNIIASSSRQTLANVTASTAQLNLDKQQQPQKPANQPSTDTKDQTTTSQPLTSPESSPKKTKRKVTIDANTVKKIAHWPSSRQNTPAHSHGTSSLLPTPGSLKLVDSDYFDDIQPIVRKSNGKYEEIPHVLDGFRMLNRAPAEDPEDVYVLDISSQELLYVIEDDMTLFTKLHTLRAGENALPFARLGVLPALRKLVLPCNGVRSLDLELDGRYRLLESLDLSFNAVDQSAQIMLATLPNLKYLDLTSNGISRLAPEIRAMGRWRDRVIELVLPNQVAALDAKLYASPERPSQLQSSSAINAASGISQAERLLQNRRNSGGAGRPPFPSASKMYSHDQPAGVGFSASFDANPNGRASTNTEGRAFHAFIERRNSSRRRSQSHGADQAASNDASPTTGRPPTVPQSAPVSQQKTGTKNVNETKLTDNDRKSQSAPTKNNQTIRATPTLDLVMESNNEDTEESSQVQTKEGVSSDGLNASIGSSNNSNDRNNQTHADHIASMNAGKNSIHSSDNSLFQSGRSHHHEPFDGHDLNQSNGWKSSMSETRETEDGDAQPLDRTAPSEINPSDIREQQEELRGSGDHSLTEAGNGGQVGMYESGNTASQNALLNGNPSQLIDAYVGFATLEVLVLENNRLGITGLPDFWYILSALPKLRVLNLNNNGIRTLRHLVPESAIQTITALPATESDSKATLSSTSSNDVPLKTLLNIHPQVLPKFNGFSSLQVLYLVRNKISNLDDLVGIVCLQHLRHVFLESNSIMQPFIVRRNGLVTVPNPGVSMVSKSMTTGMHDTVSRAYRSHKHAKHGDVDIPKVFAQVYGIRVSDACFQPHYSVLEDEIVVVGSPLDAGVIGGIHRRNKHDMKPIVYGSVSGSMLPDNGMNGSGNSASRYQQKPHFIGKYMRKRPHVQHGHHIISHTVHDTVMSTPKEWIRDRQSRRMYEFTDEDLQEIVRCGRIPPIRELVKMAERRAAADAMNSGDITVSDQAGDTETTTHDSPDLSMNRKTGLDLSSSAARMQLNNQIRDDQHSLVTAPTESDAGNMMPPHDIDTTNLDASKSAATYEPRLPVKNHTESQSTQSFDTFGESITSSMQEIMYDPDHLDDTFLTGVHITGGRRRQPRQRQRHQLDADGVNESVMAEEEEGDLSGSKNQPDDMHASYGNTMQIDAESGHREDDDDESDNDSESSSSYSGSSYTGSDSGSSYTDDDSSITSYDTDDIDEEAMNKVYPLPNTIQASVRALRHALTNPVSYWRIMEESYARPTYASLKRKTAFVTGDQLRNEATSAAVAVAQEIRGAADRRGSRRGDEDSRGQDELGLDGVDPDSSGYPNNGMFGDSDTGTLSMLSTPLVRSYVTPANSVWTPTHGDTRLVSISDYVPPTEISTKTKAPVGTVTYRRRAELPLGQKGGLMNTEDQRRLQRQLEIKLRQRQGGKRDSVAGPASGDANAFADDGSDNAGGDVDQAVAAARRQQSITKKLTTTAALQRAQLAGRLRPKDEFDELDDMMNLVDSRLKTIEANLNDVLKSSRLKERLPQSSKLYEQLRREYARIQNMYLEDAKNVVKSEPLSQRLRKLGITAAAADGPNMGSDLKA